MNEFTLRPVAPAGQAAQKSSPLDKFAAGVRQESGIVNLLDSLYTNTLKADPNFNLTDYLSARKELLPYQDYFSSAESEVEADLIHQKLKDEMQRRVMLGEGGWSGFVGEIAGALLSPSTFIPVVGAAGKVRNVAAIAASAAGGAALDEVILQDTQAMRTAEESAYSVVGAALLGTVLGAGVSVLSGREAASAAKNAVSPLRKEVVDRPMPAALGDGSIGARAVQERPRDPGGLLGTLSKGEDGSPLAKLQDAAIRTSGVTAPNVRNLLSEVPEVRAWQSRLSTGELQFRSSEATAPGGTVERRIAYKHRSLVDRGDTVLQEQYAKYRTGKTEPGRIESGLALVKGVRDGAGKMSTHKFNTAVALEMQIPQPNQIPEVKAAAEALAKEVYEPLLKELIEVGVLPKELAKQVEDGQVRGAISYLNHVFDKDAIESRPGDFDRMVERNYQRKMAEAYVGQTDKTAEKVARAELDISLLSKTDEEAAALQADIREQRAAFAESEAADIRSAIYDATVDLRRAKKAATTNDQGPFSRARAVDYLTDRIEALRQLLSEHDLEEIAKDNELRRQSTMLSKSVGRLAKRQQVAWNRLEQLEEGGIATLRRVAKRIGKFDAEMDKLSEEAFAKGVAELQDDMAAAVAKLETIETKSHAIREANPEFETGSAIFATRIQRFRREVFPGGKLVIETEAERAEALMRLDDFLARGTWTDQQAKSLTTLRNDIASAKLRSQEDIDRAFEKAWRLEEQRYAQIARIDTMADQLEALSRQDPAEARALLAEWQRDIAADVKLRGDELTRRQDKLRELAQRLDPENSARRISELEVRATDAKDELKDWVRKRGGDVVDGVPDFSAGGRDYARDLRQRILGDPSQMPAFEIMQGPRGPELARVLDIPLEEKMEFLKNDVSELMHIYTRTVVPDIELTRSGIGLRGEGVAPDVIKAYEKRLMEVDAATELPPKKTIKERLGLSGPTLEEWKAAESRRLYRERDDALLNFQGQIERLRHTRGVPDNADGYLYRGGRALQNLNVVTMMGNVLLSSLVDPAIAVSRYGLTRVFKHAFLPMIKGMKEFKLTKREALYYGMNELTHQARFNQLNDMFDKVGRQNRGEKALDFLANKIGIVGLFSYWNQFIKTALTPVAAGRLLDAADVVVNGATHMPADEARRVLAALNIDGDLAQRIMAQQANGGLVKSNGLWVPNTESWTDAAARDAFRTAVLGDIDAVVITPGLERPLFTDMNMPARLLTQFQSFMWSSHVKILMAGMQEPDRKILEGFLAASFLGAAAFAADMAARGRSDELEGLSPGEWADNILVRSPFLGALAQAREMADAVPGLKPYVNFSDTGATTRRFADAPLSAVLGPSYGTAKRFSSVLTQADDPTTATVDNAQRLLPYNNVFYLRSLFDAAGNALPVRAP